MTGKQAADPHYARGVAMMLAAGTCLSVSGAVLRLMDGATGWQILLVRSWVSVAVLMAFLLFRYGRRTAAAFLAIGVRGLLIGLVLGVGTICYIFALMLTTVADAMFIMAIHPFLAAIMGIVFLRERVGGATWAAMALTLAGIAMMVAEGVTGGHLAGKLLALVPGFTLASMVVLLRSAPRVDMVPGTCLGVVISGTVALVMVGSGGDGPGMTGHDIMLSALLGTVQFGAGFLLVTLGSPLVPAALAALLMLAEPVLASLWAWLVVDEVPAPLAFAGGAVVLTALAARAAHGIRREHRLRAG